MNQLSVFETNLGKKSFIVKILSLILIVSILSVSLPVYCFASGDNSGFSTEKKTTSLDNLRSSLYTLLSSLPDGSGTLSCYPYPVKYIDSNGELREKGLTLVEKDGSFVPESNNILSSFPRKITDGIRLEYENISISLVPEMSGLSDGTVSENNTHVTYSSEKEGISYSYSLTYMGFKEEITVDEYNGVCEYKFLLETNGLVPTESDGEYYLCDEKDVPVALVGDVIVFTADEKNNFFGSVSFETLVEREKYSLTVTLDEEALKSDNTAYPIVIDPSIEINPSLTDENGIINDVTVGNSATYSSTRKTNLVGLTSTGGIVRTVMNFPNLDLSGLNITYAQVQLRDTMCESFRTEVQCYEYLGNSWSESNPLSWSQAGLYGELLDSRFVYYGNGNCEGSSQRYAFDITSLAKKWAAGKADVTKGVLFKTTDEYEGSDAYLETGEYNAYRTFGSWNRTSYYPSIVINYTDISGVNSFYSYDTRSVGSYLNVHTGHKYGNLVAEYSFPTKGNFPEALSMVYNSTDGEWRLSICETLERDYKTYTYTDFTGAKHTFAYKSVNKFESKDLDAEITVSDSSLVLLFSDGRKKTFDTDGQIVSYEENGEEWIFVYNSVGQLVNVTKDSRTEITVTYTGGKVSGVNGCAVRYNVVGLVSSLSDKYGNTVSVSYTEDSLAFSDSLTDTSVVYVSENGKVTRITELYGTEEISGTEISYSEGSTVYSTDGENSIYLFGINGDTVDGGDASQVNPNLIQNSTFGSLSGWSGNGSLSQNTRLFGNKSLRLDANQYESTVLSLEEGDCVFSVYFNTADGMGGIKLKVTYGNVTVAESESINGVQTENGWYRVSLPFTAESSGTYTLSVVNENSGTVYADCPMAEYGTFSTAYNLLGIEGVTIAPYFSYPITLQLDNPANESIFFSSLLKDETGSGKNISAEFVLNYSNGTNEIITLPFESFIKGTRFVGQEIFPSADETLTITSATLYLKNRGPSSVTFENPLVSFGGVFEAEEDIYSQNLQYTSNNNGTCKVYNKGTNTDRDVYIPPVSPAGDTVTSIGAAAFRGYTDIDTVTVPDTVTSLGNYAFRGCTVKSVIFEGKLTSITYCAFLECSNLTEVNIPDTVTSFGTSAFNGADLRTLILPEGFTSFGTYSVFGNANLEKVYIPSSVTTIGKGAFNNCGAFDIYYEGTQTEWNAITKGTSAIPSGAVIHCNCKYKDGCVYENIMSGTTVTATRVLLLSDDSVIKSYVYDSCGNITQITDAEGKSEYYSYDSDGNMTSYTDMYGRTTSYTYSSFGDVLSETLPDGGITYYVYYSNGLLHTLSKDGTTVTYTYTSHAEISSITITANGLSQIYTCSYSDKGLLLSVSVGNRVLETYTYDPYGNISGIEYANGQEEGYVYDGNGNLVSKTENGTILFTREYGVDGTLLLEKDGCGNTSLLYLVSSDGYSCIELVPDGNGGFTEKEAPAALPEGIETSTETDTLGRTTVEKISNAGAEFILDWIYYGNSSDNPSEEFFSNGSLGGTDYAYSYDSLDRLTEIRKDGIILQKYYYDLLSQLIREDNAADNRTYVWEYDGNGNITAKKEYAFTTADTPGTVLSTVTYGYSDSNWKDLLTSYNGVTISSDLSGNPLNWRNASLMTWSGRKLTGLTLTDNTAVSYTYNADGIRTEKTVGTRHTEYLLDGTKVLKQTTTDVISNTTEQILFYYDTNEELIGFHYDLHDYWYGKDTNGVIRYIYNEYGEICAEYTYDAWGRVISADNLYGGTVADVNPFRYKSYYYDTETGFYYLQSRYYDPTIARFISADSVDFLGTSGSVLSYNLFCYCENDGVRLADPEGTDAVVLLYRNAAKGFGHASIIFQDSSRGWWLFYWGSGGSNLATYLGLNVKPYYMLDFLSAWGNFFLAFRSLNDFLKNRYDFNLSIGLKKGGKNAINYYSGLTDYIYIKGDFSKTLKYYTSYKPSYYNLYSNNCMQMVLNGLKKGKISGNGVNFICEINKLSKLIIPNDIFKQLALFIKKKGIGYAFQVVYSKKFTY